MLNLDVNRRLSMEEALLHPWLREEDEVKTPLQVDTFSIKNNAMRTKANTTFGDSSFDRSASQSTLATTPAVTTPISGTGFLLDDQYSQDFEGLRLDTNVNIEMGGDEHTTRRGLSSNDSANLGSIVNAFPSVPDSDVGIPYPEKPSWVNGNESFQSRGQDKSAIFVGELGSAWSPASAATNGKPSTLPVTPQDTIMPRNKRKSHPQSAPPSNSSSPSRAPSPSETSSLSSLSDSDDERMPDVPTDQDADADEEDADANPDAMDVSTPAKPVATGKPKRATVAASRRAAASKSNAADVTGPATRLRTRAAVSEIPAKKRKIVRGTSPSPATTKLVTRKTRAASGAVSRISDEASVSTPRPTRKKSIATKSKGSRR